MHSARSDPPAITQTLGYKPARDNHKIYKSIPPPPPPPNSPNILLTSAQKETKKDRLLLPRSRCVNVRELRGGA
jgi:hypothetical protein